MPAVELPNGQSAIIASRAEMSERSARRISRSYLRAASSADKLNQLGFNNDDPSTWHLFATLSEEDQDALEGYQAALIVNMVRQWTLGELPTDDTVLDLPKATFEALANACGAEFSDQPDFSPDIDPKAPTADSPA